MLWHIYDLVSFQLSTLDNNVLILLHLDWRGSSLCFVSTMYATLNDQRPYSQMNALSKWEAELNVQVSSDKWQKAFKYTHKASYCSNHWETYKKKHYTGGT